MSISSSDKINNNDIKMMPKSNSNSNSNNNSDYNSNPENSDAENSKKILEMLLYNKNQIEEEIKNVNVKKDFLYSSIYQFIL
jgi:hypothetical protein